MWTRTLFALGGWALLFLSVQHQDVDTWEGWGSWCPSHSCCSGAIRWEL